MVAGIKLIYSLAFGSLQRYPRELGLFDLRFESSLPDKLRQQIYAVFFYFAER